MNMIKSLNCPNIHMGTFDEIESGNYNFKDFTVILVGNKKIDDEKMSLYADVLLKSGCENFGFCGKYAEEWHNLFDLRSLAFFEDSDDVALTYTIDSITDMPDEFCICLDNVFIYADTYKFMRKCHKAIVNAGCGVRVKYIGPDDSLAFDREKEYVVLSIEKGWYRIMTDLDEDYLFPPEVIEIVEDNNGND